jgi:carbon-monoxide dehydrogenase medium subunit
MKPARFSYEAPQTLAAAIDSLARRREGAKIIAGGQSLAPMMNMRLAQPQHLIDINGLSELANVRHETGRIVIGALVRHADAARDPLIRQHVPMLAHAVGTIGHYAIRQRGTVGGSLAHADPAAQLPLVAVALDASIESVSARGSRVVPAAEFFQGIFTTALEADEILTALHVPLPVHPEGWGFRLFRRRAGDFALLAVAATVASDADGMVRLRLAVGGLGPTPVRITAAEQAALAPPDADWARRVAETAAATAEIETSEQIPTEYRRDLLIAMAQDVLNDAKRRAYAHS